jgi:phospholipid/cholesterol/gamma-HCH transport system substrate-binding protein
MPLKKSTDSMKFSSEAKIGLIGIVTVLVLIWGINYLKGRNILRSTYRLYAFYTESGGLESSAPVQLKGVKIGFVDQVILRPGEDPSIMVGLDVQKKYRIPAGSGAELFSADLMGTKAIRILPSESRLLAADGDTLIASTATDLLAGLQAELFPVLSQVARLAASLDTLSNRLADLLAGEELSLSLGHLASFTASLEATMTDGGSLDQSLSSLESFSSMLEEQEDELASMMQHLRSLSARLDSAGLDRLAGELHALSEEFNTLLSQVNTGQGSAGKLIYSDSLYDHLDELVLDLNLLVKDLNENPEDYVHLSVFGKSAKKKR